MKNNPGAFVKLYRKIYYTLFFLCLALLVLIDATAFTMVITTFGKTYRSSGTDKATRVMNAISIHLVSAETTTYSLAHNEDVIRELSSPAGYILLDTLNKACYSSMKISAVTAYSLKGSVYTSSDILDPPSLNDFAQDPAFARFFDGDEKAFLSFRTGTIAKIYNNNLYPAEMGVITCCQKVFSGDELVGYIFSDVLPDTVYAYFSGEGEFDGMIPFIILNDGNYFSCAENAQHVRLLAKSNAGGYFRYTTGNDQFSIAVFESMRDFNLRVSVLCVALLAVSVLLLVAIHFIARKTAQHITGRLDRFLNKMESEPYSFD